LQFYSRQVGLYVLQRARDGYSDGLCPLHPCRRRPLFAGQQFLGHPFLAIATDATAAPYHGRPKPDDGEHETDGEHHRTDVTARGQVIVEQDGPSVDHLHVDGPTDYRVLGRYQVTGGHRYCPHGHDGQPEYRVHAVAVAIPTDFRFHKVFEVVIAATAVLRNKNITSKRSDDDSKSRPKKISVPHSFDIFYSTLF